MKSLFLVLRTFLVRVHLIFSRGTSIFPVSSMTFLLFCLLLVEDWGKEEVIIDDCREIEGVSLPFLVICFLLVWALLTLSLGAGTTSFELSLSSTEGLTTLRFLFEFKSHIWLDDCFFIPCFFCCSPFFYFWGSVAVEILQFSFCL